MNKKPIVSIVTPSLNQSKFLEETIISVISQDYPFIEYIIMDGGSSDNSTNIIRQYQDKISYWVSETDKGQANAINKGWKICHGEILAFLNSDDTYQPGAITKIVDAFDKHPEWGMIYGDAERIDAESRFIQYCKAGPFNIENELYIYTIIQPTVFIRRNVFESVGWLDEQLLISIDFDYFMRIATSRFSIGVLEGVHLANTRMHSETKTSKQTIKFIYDNEFIINRTIDESKSISNKKKVRKKALSYLYIYQTKILLHSGDKTDARKSFIKAIRKDPFIIFGERFGEIVSLLIKITCSDRLVSWVRQIKLWASTKTIN
jgi:glycosyltransferase involved in cell wall biosynthesis